MSLAVVAFPDEFVASCLPGADRGSRMQVKLTQAFVAKAKAEAGAERTVYWDTTLPGFGLMVTANGHRSFVLQYRAHSISRRLTLNGDFLRLEAAREKKLKPVSG